MLASKTSPVCIPLRERALKLSRWLRSQLLSALRPNALPTARSGPVRSQGERRDEAMDTKAASSDLLNQLFLQDSRRFLELKSYMQGLASSLFEDLGPPYDPLGPPPSGEELERLVRRSRDGAAEALLGLPLQAAKDALWAAARRAQEEERQAANLSPVSDEGTVVPEEGGAFSLAEPCGEPAPRKPKRPVQRALLPASYGPPPPPPRLPPPRPPSPQLPAALPRRRRGSPRRAPQLGPRPSTPMPPLPASRLPPGVCTDSVVVLGGEELGSRACEVEVIQSFVPLRSAAFRLRLPEDAVQNGGVKVVGSSGSSALLFGPRRGPLCELSFDVDGPAPDVFRSGARWERRVGASAVAHEGRVYLAGGLLSQGMTASVVSLDEVGQGPGVHHPPLPSPRRHFCLVVHRGFLVALGGADRTGTRLRSVLRLRLGDPWALWEELPPLPKPTADGSACSFNGRLYIAGGYGDRGHHNSVYALGSLSRGWVEAGQLAFGRDGLSLVVFRGVLFALGGLCGYKGQDASWARCVEAYDEGSGRWELLQQSLRLPVYRSLAFVVGEPEVEDYERSLIDLD